MNTIRNEDVPSSPDYRHLSSIAGIAIELRYATPDNFVGRDLYSPHDCAWLHRDAAAALEQAVAWLAQRRPGSKLLVLDALRPQRVQEQLWAALQGTELLGYLAEPTRGSIHSFGMAVDLTIVDEQGRELDMGTGFDDLSELSHPALEQQMLAKGAISVEQIANRELLRGAMFQAGFVGINSEWWHFDCGDRVQVRATFTRVL
ncbi:D-alanyl-D-alanine dipeptidase [Massilia sp. Root351]|uniref:M15 family metallopeptidase n=1 Tax=Massilia sp. Root351 TaxID=1736522 RepID=UPI000708ECCE|nr:M15 family metallopeptidase [Massilia sp. Root351]KQV89964.1 D-alanyl-D-alanine dipeptidase [Massilia sp. Root351]